MTPSGRRFLVACDGAAIPPAVTAQEWTARRDIRTAGPDANLELSLAGFGGAILKTLGPRSADLIRLAAYVYRADQLVSRGGDRDAHGARWRRHLTLCVPVAEPAFWSGSAVTERLAAALRFLTDDVWEFAFAEAPPELGQLPLAVPTEEVFGQPTAIVPFSGGIDSLCVLVELVASGGRPIAISHWSTEAHKARQLELLARLRQRFRGWAFPLLGLPLHGKGGDPPDSSQRSRGFLYAAVAAAVAGELGLTRVLFGDNGPVSINLPMNDQLVGALASRSTHPQFHYRFNQLADALYSSPIAVTNPLRERTRAEALGVLQATHCTDLLPLTNSCSKWRGLPAATPHCGGCSQCVDRRFATVAAGLEGHDPAARYRRDVFLDEPVNWEADQTAQSYVRFAQRVYRMDDTALVEAFPQVYDLPTPDDPDPEATVRSAVDLTKRYATSTVHVLRTVADRHLDALVDGSLPTDCLLRKIMGSTWPGMAVGVDGRPPTAPDPSVSAPLPSDSSEAPDKNVFACDGRLWTLSYGGLTKHMPHRVGLTRLAVLLREPGREFSPEELLVAAEGATGETMSQAEAERHNLRPEAYAGGGTVLDRPALDALKEAPIHLLRDLDAARNAGDSEEVERLEAQVHQVVYEMKAGTGLGGTLKPFVDNRARRRDAAYHSLHRILSEVKTAHPELGAHLVHSVRLRAPYSYAPEVTVSWHVVLP